MDQRYLAKVALQALCGGFQRDRVAVHADEAPRGEVPADLQGMSGAAERTVEVHTVRAQIQRVNALP